MGQAERQPLDALSPLVSDLHARGLLDEFSVVSASTEFRDLAHTAAALPHVRTVAVTNDDGRLTGIIPMQLLYGGLIADVYPGAVLADVVSGSSALQFVGSLAQPAADQIMLESQSVSLTDTLHDAFIAVYRSDLSGLPVVDAESRPVGYLDLMALFPLWAWRSRELQALVSPR